MPFQLDRYLSYLEHTELSAEAKERALRAVWSLVESKMDMYASKHPLQQFSGKTQKNNLQSPAMGLDSKTGIRQSFEHAAAEAEKGA